MPNGLLINYNGPPHEISSLFPDQGLAGLASVLIKAGHDVKILDYSTVTTIRKIYSMQIQQALSKLAPSIFSSEMLVEAQFKMLIELEHEMEKLENDYLEEQVPKLSSLIIQQNVSWIGFKLWSGTILKSMYLAEKLKTKFPSLKIFCGGPSVDLFQYVLLEEFSVIDAAVFSEGEYVLLKLMDWLEGKCKISDISGIFFRENGKIKYNRAQRITDLNSLPFPNYDSSVYPAMGDSEKLRIFCFDESRGCPSGCYYCPDVNKYQKKRYEKTAERCVAEIAYLKNRYNMNFLRFSGSNTTSSLLLGIAKLLKDRKIFINYSIFSTANGMNEETLSKLQESGLSAIFIGLESADSQQAKFYLGKNNIKRVMQIAKLCKDNNIFFNTSVIYPAPYSSSAVFQKNLSFLTECLVGNKNSCLCLYPAGLYPFTKWYQEPEKFGFEINCETKEEYLRQLLKYKYNAILPRYLWKDLPYKLNGKPFKNMLFETHELATKLAQQGVLVYTTEANLIMAKCLGYTDYAMFHKDSSIAFFTGNHALLEHWNELFLKQSNLLT